MATIFLSCQRDDSEIGSALELRLRARGHFFLIPASTKIHGDWRAKQLKAMADSDAVVFLLSPRGLASPDVLGQIGSARVYNAVKGQQLLPVLVGLDEIPKFVADIQCFELPRDHADDALDELADEIHQAVEDHAHQVPKAPRVFVSHRHKDEPLAAALVSVLEAAFHVEKSDIRCTSVQPYALPPGERVSDRLRSDVNGAELVLGMIGPETSESRYVLFELGASWGRGVPTFPVLVRGATSDDVPGPLSERHSISMEDERNCLQLVDDIADATSLARRQGVSGRVATEARRLAELATGLGGALTPPAAPAGQHARPFGIDREALRFGITLGWQLARYEFAYDSKIPEAQAAAASIAAEIERLLKHDGFPDPVVGLSFHDLMNSVLSHYSTTSSGKHAAIMLGVASMRASLVGASRNEDTNREMEHIGFSALAEVDPAVLPNKAQVYRALLERKPQGVVGVIQLIDELSSAGASLQPRSRAKPR